MKPVVMKFGGTSVEDAAAINRTAKIVAEPAGPGPTPGGRGQRHGQSHRPASGRSQSRRPWRSKRRVGHQLAFAQPSLRHFRPAAPGTTARAELQNWIQQEFESIDEILRGLSAVGELTPRTNDLVVSFGERLSSRLVAEAFRDQGIPAVHVDARTCIVTDAQHGKATPNSALIEARCGQHLQPLVDAGQVPVMGGFIGSTVDGVTTTLGRGGSDYTAALIGGGMDAEAIEIWTDVNGIMTADPRVCPDALRVKTISFEEAAELAYFGAKVLHPATILPAVQKNIPVLVLNSRNAENEGTRITALATHCRSPFKSIAAKRRLTIIDLVASRMLMSHGYLRAVFEVFDKHKCAVDMVSTSEVSVSLTVDSNEQLPELAADLSKLADVTYEGRKALICMVGGNIRGQNGIAAQVFHAVRHINVRMISQGASEINMSFMIDEDDVDEAVRSLHAAFFVDPDPEIFDVERKKNGGKRASVTMIFLVLGRGKTGQVVADVASQRGHSVRVIGEEENANASALTGSDAGPVRRGHRFHHAAGGHPQHARLPRQWGPRGRGHDRMVRQAGRDARHLRAAQWRPAVRCKFFRRCAGDVPAGPATGAPGAWIRDQHQRNPPREQEGRALGNSLSSQAGSAGSGSDAEDRDCFAS